MFRLPTSNAKDFYLPITDHSAISLLTALLSNDLDDRIDTIRNTLETDPLLACWTVNEAALRHDAELKNLHVAARWLSQNFLSVINPAAFSDSQPVSIVRATAWRSISSTAINAARHAREIAARHQAPLDIAFWWALLCCTKRQVESLAKLNGHSPLHGVHWYSPDWIQQLDENLKKCVHRQEPHYAANQGIGLTASTDKRWLSDDELNELHRPSSAPNQLVPLLIENLSRLHDLESKFAQTVHEEKMAAMQQLAYGASHEINNPLANISTRAQSLMHNEHDTDRRRKLLAINDQAFRAYEMIADLMLFAKPPKMQIEPVSLKPLIERIRTELETPATNGEIVDEAASRNNCIIRVRITDGDEAVAVKGDSTQLGVAIKAICDNGIEAMAGHGELTIEMSKPNDDKINVSIEDTGQGLSELAKRHLFDPFFSGREAGRGMGFGLSKAWRIIEQHHGRIAVRSDPTRGSCFTITLPTHRSTADAITPDAQV